MDAFVEEGLGWGGVDDVGQGLDQLLAKARFQGAQGTEQLHDFDEHPIVSGQGEQLEEERGEGKVVLGVLACELADNVDRARNCGCVAIFQLFLELWKRWSQRIWEFQENFVHDQHRLLADIGAVTVHQGDNIRDQVSSQVISANISKAIDRKANFIWIC